MLSSPAVLRAARHRLRLLAFCSPSGLSPAVIGASRLLPARRRLCIAAPALPACPTRAPARVHCVAAESQPASAPVGRALVAAVKAKASAGAPRKALELLSAAHADRDIEPVPNDAYRSAARALIRANRPDLALAAYRLQATTGASDPGLSAAVMRACLRGATGLKRNALRDLAAGVAESLDALLMGAGDVIADPDAGPVPVSAFATALCTAQVALLKAEDATSALRAARALQDFASLGGRAAAQTSEYNELIRWYGKRRRMEGVFATMDAMRAAGVAADAETFEFLANAAVRSVRFVTGAVSMDTLPEPLAAEVAFCGRSNVGKSSLVNMLVNRKALARVSGTPGKTQQFNYFVVNEAADGGRYYLVDLPGVGYAKVPKTVREPWVGFMHNYFSGRPSLQVVFHLIDGRHGPLADDDSLMQMIADCGFTGEYVVVLTKMDKMDKQKVKSAVMRKVTDSLRKSGCHPDTPVIVTSSATRLGRDELWMYLQKALKETVPQL